jgi:hypothetical protein
VASPQALAVSARLLAGLGVVGAVIAACSPAMEPVGITPAHQLPPPPAPSASASTPAWSHAAEVANYPRVNAKRFPSSGHFFGRYDADVFVGQAARASYASIAPGSSLPVGSIVVEVHTDHDGKTGPVLAMEKGASGWTYLELDARLRVQRQGRLSPCVECHGHVASQDELFGVPATGR